MAAIQPCRIENFQPRLSSAYFVSTKYYCKSEVIDVGPPPIPKTEGSPRCKEPVFGSFVIQSENFLEGRGEIN